MIPWLRFERRWRQALLEAMLPLAPQGPLPPLSALDLGAFWPRFHRGAPLLLRVGLRLAVWTLWLGPAYFIGRWRTFGGLDATDRDRVLAAAGGHPRFLVRQLVLALKLLTCWAYLADRWPRQALGGARVDDPSGDADWLQRAVVDD